MSEKRWIWQSDWVIPSELAHGSRVLEEIIERLEGHEWTSHDVYSVRLALDEAIVNAIKHGNCLDEKKCVRIACKLSPQGLWVEITDEGPGFKPEEVPDCTCDENLEVPSGRGLMLMRCFMSRVEFSQQGNCVTMEKLRCQAAESDSGESGSAEASPSSDAAGDETLHGDSHEAPRQAAKQPMRSPGNTSATPAKSNRRRRES